MEYQVIDNFLPVGKFKELQKLIVFNFKFPFLLKEYVSNVPTKENSLHHIENSNWNWYGFHMIYDHIPYSEHCDHISSIFLKKFNEIEMVKSVIRIKANFYPWTNKVYEHAMHSDYPYSHKAAVYSLNTCDGYTRMSNGDKVESVQNRIVIFDASEPHASSTTSDSKGRFNINFNWL